MIVATAMKEELEKYEGVEVYLTRDVDKDMSLEERVEFALSGSAVWHPNPNYMKNRFRHFRRNRLRFS